MAACRQLGASTSPSTAQVLSHYVQLSIILLKTKQIQGLKTNQYADSVTKTAWGTLKFVKHVKFQQLEVT